MSDRTLSFDDVSIERSDSSLPRLVRALQSRRPLDPPVVVELDRNVEVEIGRGTDPVRHESRAKQKNGILIRIDTNDDRMSGAHARVVLRSNRWTLVDCESKNGSYVNGERVATAALSSGDQIELGSTVFIFRDPVRVINRSTASGVDEEHPALRTANAELADLFATLRRVAASDISVLVRGETGTGKELTARAVHETSGRTGNFIPVNCGAIPATLVESQLFGHVKGAFSGADRDSIGLVRAADGGTLFLDEIAELAEDSQVALLRVLQQGEVTPVGTTSQVHVDVRVIAATHRDLEDRISKGQFREDLYARLAGAVVTLPPLRDRKEDLGILVAAILRDLAGDRLDTAYFKRRTLRALFAYEWPRNVRELRAALQLALTVGDDAALSVEHFPDAIRGALAPAEDQESPASLRPALIDALQQEKGNVSAAARRLGYSRAHIHRLMKRFDVDPAKFRS